MRRSLLDRLASARAPVTQRRVQSVRLACGLTLSCDTSGMRDGDAVTVHTSVGTYTARVVGGQLEDDDFHATH